MRLTISSCLTFFFFFWSSCEAFLAVLFFPDVLFSIIFLLKVSSCLGELPSLLCPLRKSCKNLPRGCAKPPCFSLQCALCPHRCLYLVGSWYHCEVKPQESATNGFYFDIMTLDNLTEIRSLVSFGDSTLIKDIFIS